MTFHTFLQALHIVVCLAMIIIVMVQASEGEGLSGAFGGGGSYALFGKRGATGFVAQATTMAAILFMVTSFSLAYSVKKDSAANAAAAAGEPFVPASPNTGAPLAQ